MSDDARIQNNTSNSAPTTPGSGADTEIRIRPLDPLADSVIHLAGGSSIRSRARDSSQDTSNILLEATEVRLKEGSSVSSTVSSGPASAGDVEIVVDRLSLEGGAFIESEALSSSTGNAGDINVLARESVSLVNDDGGVRTQISNTNRGTGTSGQISLGVTNDDGTGTVVIDGDAGVQSNNWSLSGSVSGGDIRIDADVVRIENGGFVESVAVRDSRGPAGNVTISATGSLAVRGFDANGIPSLVSTSSFGDGTGGAVRLSAPSIVVADGGLIDTLTFGPGDGGTIRIGRDSDIPVDTEELLVANGGRVVADSRGVGTGAGAAGSITANVDRLTMRGGGQITADTTDGDGGTITIRARESVSLEQLDTDSESTFISTATFGTGDGGRLAVTATNDEGTGTVLVDGATIESKNWSPSRGVVGGDVRIDADVVRVENGGLVSSAAVEGSGGSAGNVTIGAISSLSVRGSASDGTRSLVTTSTRGEGEGGELRLSAGRIAVTDGASIVSRTYGPGDGGTIRIGRNVDIPIDTEELVIEDSGGVSASSFATGTLAGAAGSVIVKVDRLVVDTDGFITALTFDGNGGTIAIGANSSISIRGRSLVSSATLGKGSGGEVRLSAGHIAVADGAVVSSTTDRTGNGGTVRIGRALDIPIDTEELLVQDAIISAQSASVGADAGNAGSVVVGVGRLVLESGGQMAATTLDGTGGRIEIRASESATFDGTSVSGFPSGVFSGTEGAGPGGGVTIDTPHFEMIAGAEVASIARAESSAPAGDINLQVGVLELGGDSVVSAQNDGTGSAGTIDVRGTRGDQPAESLVLRTGRISTTSRQAGGGSITLDSNRLALSGNSVITTDVRSGTESGNVDIRARFVQLDSSNVTADGGEGAGGNISIVADGTESSDDEAIPSGFLVLEDISEVRADGGNQGGKITIQARGFSASESSLVQARARQPAGIAGEVGIQALVAGVSESITPLPENFLDVAELLRARCSERASGGEASSFIAAGRDGLPPEPGGLLSSSILDLEVDTSGRSRDRVPEVSRPSGAAWFWHLPVEWLCVGVPQDRTEGAGPR